MDFIGEFSIFWLSLGAFIIAAHYFTWLWPVLMCLIIDALLLTAWYKGFN